MHSGLLFTVRHLNPRVFLRLACRRAMLGAIRGPTSEMSLSPPPRIPALSDPKTRRVTGVVCCHERGDILSSKYPRSLLSQPPAPPNELNRSRHSTARDHLSESLHPLHPPHAKVSSSPFRRWAVDPVATRPALKRSSDGVRVGRTANLPGLALHDRDGRPQRRHQ